jgi:site-specific recombinase XerC
MIRALAPDLGLADAAEGVRVPRHEPGPPETLTDTDYANAQHIPDRRTIAGKRDYALLRVRGECGLVFGRAAQPASCQSAPPAHHRLYVRGTGSREREVPAPRPFSRRSRRGRQVHPLARGVRLLDEQPLFVRLGRHGDQEPLPPLHRGPCTGS